MNQILVVDNFKVFENWASKTYLYKIESLKKDNRFRVIDIDEIASLKINFKDYKILIFGWNMCYYSKYYTLKQKFYEKKIKNLEVFTQIYDKTKDLLQHPRKYLIVQDFINQDDYQYGLRSLTSYLKKHKFKGIISPYLRTPASQPIKNELPDIEIIHLPHHIDENKFKDWGLEKTCDIFIYGNCQKQRYPFRYRVVNLLKKYNDKFKLVFWDGEMAKNYFKFNPKISNENLSKQINQSWMTLCSRSYQNALLGKYFETSMSGSCVLGNMASDGEHIWKKNFVEITDEMSDEEIIKVIEVALSNKDELLKKIEMMKEIVKNYELSKYPEKLYYSLR
jgi:hypothetical protein